MTNELLAFSLYTRRIRDLFAPGGPPHKLQGVRKQRALVAEPLPLERVPSSRSFPSRIHRESPQNTPSGAASARRGAPWSGSPGGRPGRRLQPLRLLFRGVTFILYVSRKPKYKDITLHYVAAARPRACESFRTPCNLGGGPPGEKRSRIRLLGSAKARNSLSII